MSSPTRYAPAKWRADRLRLACQIRGLTPQLLLAAVNMWRAQSGRAAAARQTVYRWLDGTVDPSRGRTGADSAVFDIAHATGVSIDWLMDRVKREPSFTPYMREKFRGHEGWS